MRVSTPAGSAQRGVADRHARRTASRPPSLANRGGFTLLELLIALAIVGALLVIALGGLRVALAAWSRGESRAEIQQHARGVTALLTRSVTGAYPYETTKPDSLERIILFDGRPDRLAFATTSPPVPLSPTIAFTAVMLSVEDGEARGLAIREFALPNEDRFDATEPLFHDPSVTSIRFRYRSPEETWEDTWDASAHQELPAAVEITLETNLHGRTARIPPITVSLKTLRPGEAP
jgi:general secretion pathway protein J